MNLSELLDASLLLSSQYPERCWHVWDYRGYALLTPLFILNILFSH